MAVRAYDWIAHHARNWGDEVACVDLHEKRALSYREFDRRIGRLAGWLRGAGVGRGDRAAILAQNCTDVFELQFACARLGAIFVPLNYRLTVPELSFIVGDAAPRVLIHDAEFAQTAAALRPAVPGLQLLERGGAHSAYEHALAGAEPPAAYEHVTHDDVSTIMYTSGTTGHPKGAMITHGMTFWNVVNLGGPAEVSSTSVFLAVLPLFHTGGLNCYSNPVFHAGGRVLVSRAFDPGEALRMIADPAVALTHFFGVPAHYQFMLQHPDFGRTDLSRLRVAGVGGAPMPVPLLEAWLARGVTLIQGYGMTETSPGVLALGRRDAARKIGSAGKPLLHTETRIVDEAGNDVPRGQMGELWVRGPNVTPGYWNRPEANRSSFTDGWLHTGDAARVDEEGYYYIVDRTKDMYISGGENVYPAEVESVLYQIPQLAEAAVIGVPDERWGEVGKAIIAVKPGQQLSAEQILDHCRENLARYKLPRFVEFVDALPRNATGKVHKPTLRQKFGKPGNPP
ncbi:MAG: long-chain fatty acid--CoA ligase, partial [Nevskia sp.]|nr:long-chain fatty acid--CoA ligase [Nevskia sp.]